MKLVRTAWALALAALCATLPARAIDRYQVWHEGRQVTVVDRGGFAVYDGDILLGPIAEVLERSARSGPDGRVIGATLAKSNTLGSACCRWPRGSSGLFEVPFTVETDPDGIVPAAVTLFNQQLAGFMRAVPRTTESDYVAFTLSATDNSTACASNIGRIGGRQTIVGSHLCGTGVLVHEMGHAIGLFHEQEHIDRASYVVVNEANVVPEQVHNYQPSTNRRSASPYDFASLMHYGYNSFSRDGRGVMETIPAGIPIGQRAGYSAADIEGIRRLYSDPPQQVTVTTNPTGLTVIVDGTTMATPAIFNWSIGSTHVLDAPANAQVANGAAHVFGRWNVDVTGDMAARRTITVVPGNDTLTAPSSRPAVSTYTANFVRYKEVRLGVSSSGVSGSVVPSPAPSSLPGVTGTYYRDRQLFALDTTTSAGARLGGWAGSFFYSTAYTTPYSSPFRGPVFFSDTLLTAYQYNALFVTYPFVTLRARAQDGDVIGVSASMTRAPATTPTSIRLPYNTVSWNPGESASITMDAVQSPFGETMRYVFVDLDGVPAPATVVVMPTAAESSRTVTANFSKEYQGYRLVIPSCAGSITMPSLPWYAHGSNVSVSLNVAPGWVMTGWEGSLSGTALLNAFQVTTHPNVIARLNTIAAPLAVSSVSPATAAIGAAIALDITGNGFTPASEVYFNGDRVTSQYVSVNRLTAAVPAGYTTNNGLAIVNVVNRVASCTVNATGAIDIVGTSTASTDPETGWWWNAAESGRGFFIEKHGNNLFMAGYYYEADGRATWFASSGPMSGSNSFSGAMAVNRNGQTLTGAYRAPTAAASPGSVSLVFNSTTSATLTWPGGTTALTRYTFGVGGANLPEKGWWWNAAESGRGFSIEIQGSTIFMAGFMYDDAGNPVWYYAQGVVNTSTGVFSGSWIQNANGQALGAAYRAPIVLNSNVGSLTLTYLTSRTATLTLPNGRAITITRFDF